MSDDARLDTSAAQTLVAITAALSRNAPAVVILRHIAREVQRLTGAETAALFQLDSGARVLLPIAAYHVPKHITEDARRTTIALQSSPLIAAALRTREIVRSNDPQWIKGVDATWRAALPPHAVLFVPMVVGGDAVGVLYLGWWSRPPDDPPSVPPALSFVAAAVGSALQALLVGRDTMRKLQHTETLLAVSRALSSTFDLYSVMRHLLRWATRTLGSDLVGAYTLQDDEWLVPVQGYRLPPERVAGLRELRISVKQNAFYAAGAATGRAMFAAHAATEPGIPGAFQETLPHRAQMFVPIVAKDRLVGGLIAVWGTRTPDVQAADIALIESIAAQAGVVIENARLFEANALQVAQLSSLHDLARHVTGQLQRSAILNALHEPLRRGLSLDALELYWKGTDEAELQLLFRVVNGALDPTAPRTLSVTGTGLAAVVAREGAAVITADYRRECASRGVTPVDDRDAYGHWLGVPALAGDEILGVLAVARRSDPFTAAHENFLSHAARLVALALRSASLYDERIRIHEELLQAQDHLVRSERLRALGEMASGIAHDFNNLLAAILGRAQLLRQQIKDPKLGEWLGVIEQSAMDGSHTVRRLQEFTRVRRDRPLAPVDLTQIVDDAVKLTEPQWRYSTARHGLHISVTTDLSTVPLILGAATELREVMTNLILNGLDAMPEGGELALTTAHQGDEVVVTIRDTGVGMSDEVKRHVFDPFFTTKGPRGTGLGLSVTYGIVSRHGGDIRVETTPGAGTTFTLTFPVPKETPAAETQAPADVPAMRSLRCLVIDDEQDIAEAIKDILIAYGHEVVTSDPPAALSHVHSQFFDVVITDLAMPGVTGWQVNEAVKRQHPGIPVILMSGFGIAIDAEERERQKIDAVLPKPIGIDDLLTALANVTTGRNA
jgi:signal transduction histidine kinase/CheY-like chemotaxis protein